MKCAGEPISEPACGCAVLPPALNYLCPKHFPQYLPHPDPTVPRSSRQVFIPEPVPQPPISASGSGVENAPNAPSRCSFALSDQNPESITIRNNDGKDFSFSANGHKQVLMYSKKNEPSLFDRVQKAYALVAEGNYPR